mmetsp:Transcript_9283/g.12585  ORF Transcript_9283/g.12585 Transcript_9283/m.12585 type:complete len:81 (+) Transcript_9283:5176-5418(+)
MELEEALFLLVVRAWEALVVQLIFQEDFPVLATVATCTYPPARPREMAGMAAIYTWLEEEPDRELVDLYTLLRAKDSSQA